MVFRCRPKPNLAAAKKVPVTKTTTCNSDVEKQVTVTKDVGEKNAVSRETSTPNVTSVKPEPPVPVTCSAPPSAAPVVLNSSESTNPTAVASAAPSVVTPTTASVAPLSTTAPITPPPSIHVVPRPPANITADSSLSSHDGSPLFVPQGPETPVLPSKPKITYVKRQPPEVRRGRRHRTPCEHQIDLDEADNEESDDEKQSSICRRKRKTVDEFLTDMRPKKKRPFVPTAQITGPLDRSTVKMRDLIYIHNVTEPPPQYRQEREIKLFGRRNCTWFDPEAEGGQGGASKTAAPISDESSKDGKSSGTNSTSSPADSTKPPATESKPAVKESKPEVAKQGQAQFVMDADGNIVLNEDSLVIRREYTDADYIDIKQDSIMGNATYSSYRTKKPRSKKWTVNETIRLYKALSTIGTDFSIMQRLFKSRTREEIKRKFKREEKARPALIDHVLSNRKSFDLSLLDNPDDASDHDGGLRLSSDSSSENEDALAKAVLNSEGLSSLKGKDRGFRRQKRYKHIDTETPAVPANPSWFHSKTAYQPDEVPAKRPRVDPTVTSGIVTETVTALRRSRGQSLDYPVPSPVLAPSPCPSTPGVCGGGVEDVLSRLIGQKMRDLSQRPATPAASVGSLSPTRPATLLPPAARNKSLSLSEFCKMEAHLDS